MVLSGSYRKASCTVNVRYTVRAKPLKNNDKTAADDADAKSSP